MREETARLMVMMARADFETYKHPGSWARYYSRWSNAFLRGEKARDAQEAVDWEFALERYKDHRYSAKRRGVLFLMTFAEWWEVWQVSGRWRERGRNLGEFCMARHGDKGAYEVGNVSIVTMEENARLAAVWRAEQRGPFGRSGGRAQAPVGQYPQPSAIKRM